MAYRFLPIRVVNRWVDEASRRGVSEVARSERGFLAAYRRAGGHPDRLPDSWYFKREDFIKRHMAQVRSRNESLWEDGEPTRRHLALIMWAYSPSASRL